MLMSTLLAIPGSLSLTEDKIMAKEVAMVQASSVQQENIGTTNLKAWKNESQNTVHEKFYPYIHIATGAAIGLTSGSTTDSVTVSVVESENIARNNYSTYASTVKSYLQPLENGNVQRVELVDDQVIVEEYGPEYKIVTQRKIKLELPFFGGYFCGKDYQFLVFGQSNMEESDEQEIMRVVQYDKAWNRLGDVSVKGANTTTPFDAGSLRMAEDNKKLFIHTCHEMYRSDDGKIHQANMTYVIKEDNMKLEQEWNEVMNVSYGYVSHSFNQFLVVEDGKLYRMDHGDAYPRGIVITKSEQDSITNCGYESVWDIQGATGANKTGVSVGGFEKVGDYLVVAGNSTTQETEEQWKQAKNRNIFLTYTDVNSIKISNKNWYWDTEEEDTEGEKTKRVWLTDYTESDGITVSTPHLVKASNQLFYVMWEEKNNTTGAIAVKIIGVDSNGNKVTEMASIYGRLSDCKPFYNKDGTIQWYTSRKEKKAQSYYERDEEGNWNRKERPAENAEVDIYKVDTAKLEEYSFAEPVDLSRVEMSIDCNEFTYQNEEPCEPEVSAGYQGFGLELDKDFSVSYTNNIRPGTGTVRIEGKGYFSGRKTFEFKINPIDISRYRYVVTPAAIVYDGAYHVPETSIYNGEKMVTIIGDEQKLYACKAGVYTVTFSAISDYGYTGTLTTNYEILPKEIENFNVILSQEEYVYKGNEIIPYITVKDGNKTIYDNTDYTVEYKNNVEAGAATAIITGKGNYKGVKKVTFKILPVNLSNLKKYTFLEKNTYISDGKEKKPRVTIKNKERELVEGTDYILTYGNNVEPGVAIVTASGIGNYTGEIIKNYTIQKPIPTPVPSKKPTSTPVNTIKPTTKPLETSGAINTKVPASQKPGQAGEQDNPGSETNATILPGQTKNPEIGNKYKDKETKAWYQITKALSGKYEAAYLKPESKNATSVKIATTIKVKGKTVKVTSIAKNACSGCKKVTKITIGTNVATIGSKAFYQCSKLKGITIPGKVTKIDTKAFAKNNKLSSITIKATKLTAKSFGSSVFSEISKKAKIVVPKSKKKSYEKLLRKTGMKKTVKIVGK